MIGGALLFATPVQIAAHTDAREARRNASVDSRPKPKGRWTSRRRLAALAAGVLVPAGVIAGLVASSGSSFPPVPKYSTCSTFDGVEGTVENHAQAAGGDAYQNAVMGAQDTAAAGNSPDGIAAFSALSRAQLYQQALVLGYGLSNGDATSQAQRALLCIGPEEGVPHDTVTWLQGTLTPP
jgi:hypothetical protein